MGPAGLPAVIVEVISVGTELLLGQIVNTNSSHIGSVLADHGLDAHFQQVVGDNLARVATAISTALRRADAVIITGGIGPTRDDLTREALCEATGREMVRDEDYAGRLRRRWEQRGREMPESNLRQAEHPSGAELVTNPKGTAPGLVLDHEGTLVFCIPGVPEEMEYLLDREVMPRIVARSGGPSVVVSRVLRTWGQSESKVGELLDDLYEGSTNPSVAFLASAGEIKVRITAKADSQEAANALIEPVAVEVQQRLAPWYYGVDGETVHVIIFRALRERGWTIGTAESMTGGMVAAALTSEPGASALVRGGLVAYDQELKGRLLGVSDLSTVVDIDTAIEMAEGGRELLGADVVVAVTGSAGPEPLEKPPGTVVIAVATPEGARGRELRMPGDRERVRVYGTTSALHLARLAVTGRWWT
ncbi:MAG TPA: competence/damage-inducible protein A [Acidimicrobiia bacterium]|nr:competence/damage-inducible protein A [Acidimicrobiia bacterium]